jgi:hypothetical protein
MIKCDFDNCTNEADFMVAYPKKHVRYICKEHILHRLERIRETVLITRFEDNK